jgi:hypothetical protein
MQLQVLGQFFCCHYLWHSKLLNIYFLG